MIMIHKGKVQFFGGGMGFALRVAQLATPQTGDRT
jgi:hypothetical protein